MTQPMTEPAVDEMGLDWMNGRVDTSVYFDHVRRQADEATRREVQRSRQSVERGRRH